jgi:predicted porin
MNKKLLTIAIAGAMAAPMTAHAVKWKMSGQVNRAVSIMDDGVRSDIRSTDNGASNTRFRMKGSEDLGNGMSVGAYWEIGIDSSPSSKAFPNKGTDSDKPFGIRQANVWFSGNWGKLTLGHTSEASDGTSGSDLSGTNLTHSGAGSTDNSADISFWNKTTGVGIMQDMTYTKYDGGRRDVIRYDSPKLGPVGIAANVGNDQSWSAAAKVNTALGGGQLSAAIGYSEDTGPATGAKDTDNKWTMSASYLFSQGTNISGHYADSEDGTGRDSQSFSVSLGHKWGPHAVEATYSEGNDIFADNYDRTGYAIEYVHSLKKANTKLYAGFLHAELDGPSGGGSYEDIDVFTVGAVVKFD